MKKIYSLFLMIAGVITFTGSSIDQLFGQKIETLWERCNRTSTRPSWFGTGTERGIAYNPYTDHVLVASRNGIIIRVLNSSTGEDITPANPLILTSLSGGTFTMQDIEVAEDGAIVLGNLGSTTSFKVYIWANEQDGGDPVHSKEFIIDPAAAGRIGDKIVVLGSWSAGTIEIWAPSSTNASNAKIFVFKTQDQGANWTSSIVTLSNPYGTGNTNTVGNAAVAPFSPGGEFYLLGNGAGPRKHNSDGAYVNNSAMPTANSGSTIAISASSVGAIKYLNHDENDYIAVYQYRANGTTSGDIIGRLKFYNVTSPTTPFEFPEIGLLGTASAGNGVSGDICIKYNGLGSYTVFNLGADQGLGAYTISMPNINISESFLPFNTTFGVASESQIMEFSGNNLGGSIKLTAPAGVELSLDGNAYSTSITLTPTDYILSATNIYVRLAADASAGNFNEEIDVEYCNHVQTGININGTVNKADQTITFDALTAKTFGDAAFDLTATASSGLSVTYESSNTNVATISGSTVTIVGAGTTTITASQAGDDNYNAATPVEQGLTVNKADQTIAFDALDAKTFGDAAFDLTATASSGLGVTYESSNTNVATISGNTVTIVGAGTTTITASQAGNDNYNAATPADQTLTVNKADQTITFGALAAKTTADAPFGLTATASSGLDVSYASSNTAVATISGSTVTIVAAGTTNITASQAGNDNYNAATDVIQQLTVTSSTGIEEIMAKEIRVYPVPAQEYIFVDLGNLKATKASLKLVDITGKTIIELKMKNSLEKIELNGLQSGVYFLNVQLDDKMIVKRLMVK